MGIVNIVNAHLYPLDQLAAPFSGELPSARQSCSIYTPTLSTLETFAQLAGKYKLKFLPQGGSIFVMHFELHQRSD